MSDFLSHLSFSEEPVIYVGAANAVIALVLAFGVPISPEMKAAVDGVILAGSAIFLRHQVAPMSHVVVFPDLHEEHEAQ